MKQYQAVIQTLERLGGQATLADLYREVMKVPGCAWATKTPFASIRRIVQTRPEMFRVRPGLWALRSQQKKLGLVEEQADARLSGEATEQSHSYYQGMLIILGNLRGFTTYIPNQDKNKRFVDRSLGELRTLREIPAFSYEALVRRSSSVDVTWFNDRHMPDSLFEVEHSTDIQNSLLKFHDLQDFHARMIVVADRHRRREFDQKIAHRALREIARRVDFLAYDTLVKQYEFQLISQSGDFVA